jgi:hypothetical protein
MAVTPTVLAICLGAVVMLLALVRVRSVLDLLDGRATFDDADDGGTVVTLTASERPGHHRRRRTRRISRLTRRRHPRDWF